LSFGNKLEEIYCGLRELKTTCPFQPLLMLGILAGCSGRLRAGALYGAFSSVCGARVFLKEVMGQHCKR
jgi:hypothetical protein